MNVLSSSKRSFFIKGAFLVAFLLALPAMALAIPQKGEPAPPFKVTSTSGQQITLANYRGSVLIIDFFASWCQPCKRSIPHLIELNRKYGKKGLQILGLSLDEDRDDLVDFITPLRLNYPAALANEDLQVEYGLRSIPTFFIINKRGVVAEKYMGLTDEVKKNVEATIIRLLAE